ncbi:MAG: bifunctional adenosylcobinamide kinase/adenosylcobinamide-phosphate guanylyltransferase [Polyangiaceae bacterium]
MESNRIVLIGGGVRSGKSSFAVDLGQRLGQKRAFIATATRSDDEMSARIDRHQRDRRDAFTTVEAPVGLAEALDSLAACDVVVVDCLTLWFSNLLLEKHSVDAILEKVDSVVRVLQERRFHAILVTNEVGMSVHPPTPLGRAFVEVCGWAHQRVARVADEVYLAVLGTVVRIV